MIKTDVKLWVVYLYEATQFTMNKELFASYVGINYTLPY